MSDEAMSIGHRLDFLESQLQTLIKGQEFIIRTLNRTTIREGNHTKQPSPQKSKQNKSIQSSHIDVSQLMHLPEALQRNIVRFTEDLSFSQTYIPDHLIATGCLSEDDCATIASKPSSKDQSRLLVRKIKARDPQVIQKFLDIVGRDHPHLQEEVNKTLEEVVQEHKQKPMCAVCIMQSTVDLRDIGDHLWQNKIISDDVYDDIYESENFQRNRPFIWSIIINSINNYETPNTAIQILKNALKSNYSHILEYLGDLDSPFLSCSCCKRRRVLRKRIMSDNESLTDQSTTSERTQSLFSLSSRSLPQVSLDQLNLSESIGKKYSDDAKIKELLEYRRQLSSQFVPQDDTENVDYSENKNQSLPYCASLVLPSSAHIDQDKKRPDLMQSISVDSTATLHDMLLTDPDIADDLPSETENTLSSELDETEDMQDTQLYDNQLDSIPQDIQCSKAEIVSEMEVYDVTNKLDKSYVKESAIETDNVFQHKNARIDTDEHASVSDTNECMEILPADLGNLKA